MPVERHEAAGVVPAGGAAGLAMQHQGQQPLGLGGVGQQGDHEPGEPHRFLGQADMAGFGGEGLIPAGAVGGVDGTQHAIEPRRQVGGGGQGEADAGIADLGLGAHKALAHGGGRHQEAGGDARGIQAQHGLQHQRRLDGRVDRRVGADKQQVQPAVRRGAGGVALRFLGQLGEGGGGGAAHLGVAGAVAQHAARGGQQPGFRPRGNAARRPDFQRQTEALGQRILRGGHIAGAGGEQGDEPPVGFARRPLRCPACLSRGGQGHCGIGGITGRTSVLA